MPADAGHAAASAFWDMEAATVAEWDAAGGDCECGGPPPEFRLPPPPRPPPMAEALDCSEAPLPDIETCDAVPVMDAEFHSSPAIPSLAVIVVCSVLLVVMVLIASALVWKHKRKMQNFLPCKTSPQNRCDAAAANGVIYEDLTNLRPRPLPQLAPGHTPCIEMVDVKGSGGGIFVCPAPPRADPYASQDLYNPVYEELSNGSAERCAESDAESEAAAVGSEDDFADEELSLGGEVEGGGDCGGDGGGGSLSGGSSSSDASSPPRPSVRTPGPRHTPSLQPPPQRHPVAPRHDHRGPPHHAPRYMSHLQSADSLAAAAAKEVVEEERGRYTLAAPARGYGLPTAFRAAPTLPSTAAERRGRSLDRRRGWRSKGSQPQAPPPSQPPPPPHEFHEGMLLDALLQLYPGGGGGGRQPGVPSVAHRLPYLMPPTAAVPAPGGGGGGTGGTSRLVNPYDSVPVLNHLHQQHHAPPAYMFSTFRPPASHDSSFGSDSGYSNHTSGGGGGGGGGGAGGGVGGSSGGRTASRSRKDGAHRLSAHSGDLVLS